MRLSGVGIGLLIDFNVLQLRNGIKRMVHGDAWQQSLGFSVFLCVQAFDLLDHSSLRKKVSD